MEEARTQAVVPQSDSNQIPNKMQEFQIALDLAYGCMASDGDVSDVELDCLKSLCIQRGFSTDSYQEALLKTQQRFKQDLIGLYDSLVPELVAMSANLDQQLEVLGILIELVVSDGVVEQGELSFIRYVLAMGKWNADALREARPEWSKYIQEGFETNLELRRNVLAKMAEGVES